MKRLHEIQIIINGGLIVHTVNYAGDLSFHEDEVDENYLEEAVDVLFNAVKDIDFSRLEGKRPAKCPLCQEATKEAGRKELPPYRDWDCTLCSMNGHDGRFSVKG